MTLDWSVYEPYQPLHHGPRAQLTRAEARESYRDWLAVRPQRWQQLQRLLDQVNIVLGMSDPNIQALNDWFRQSVEVSDRDPSRLANRWYAVVNDIAVVLGDTMIARSPGLRWAMFTNGARNISYQKPVVVGFSKVPNPNYHVDPDRLVSTCGHRVILGATVPADEFVALLTAVGAKA